MCKIKGPYTDLPVITGFKVVKKVRGKYYSPSTGMEYKVGPVPKITKSNPNFRHVAWADPLDCPFIFDKQMEGRTGVVMSIIDASQLRFGGLDDYTFLKITIKGDLMIGTTNIGLGRSATVIAGKEILSIEEVH